MNERTQQTADMCTCNGCNQTVTCLLLPAHPDGCQCSCWVKVVMKHTACVQEHNVLFGSSVKMHIQ